MKSPNSAFLTLTLSLLLLLLLRASAQRCGKQAGGKRCPPRLCCSRYGWCGYTAKHCCRGCQSQCRKCRPTPSGPSPLGGGEAVGDLIPRSTFEEMLLHPGKGFYTYNDFIAAANAYTGFATTGNDTVRKREIAAFLSQTSHETTGYYIIFKLHRLLYIKVA